jgi:protein-disulfide isomerase/uncharacterized membrane protein
MEVAKRYGVFIAAGVIAVLGFLLGDWAILGWLAALAVACAGVVLENPRAGIVATAVLGLGCSVYLFALKVGDSGASICDVNAAVSCSVVNSSPASMLFGIPIAVLGAGFFLGVAVAAAMRPAAVEHRLYPAVGLLAIGGCAYSVWLAGQAYAIGATCPMCMAIYAANGLLVWAAIRGTTQQGVPLFAQIPQVAQSSSMLTIAITFGVVTLLGQTLYTSMSKTKADVVLEQLAQPKPAPAPAPAPSAAGVATPPAPANPVPLSPAAQEDIAQSLQELYVAPRGKVELEGDEPVLGDPNAPYVVVEWACFGCPHCAQAFGHLKQLVKEESKIQVRFRSFPLSAECNPALPKGGRPEVCRAAMAATCANNQGKFWDFAGILFANQHSLGEELLARAGAQAGLDLEAYSKCMTDPKTLAEVQEDAVAGARMQIPGTPAMFLKGVTGDDWVEVCYGAQSVAAIVQGHKAGVKLLEPAGNMCPTDGHGH